MSTEKKKVSGWDMALRFVSRLLVLMLETVLMLCVALYAVMFVLAKGPSPAARERFVMSVRETSAIGFLANLYLSDEEIAEIESSRHVGDYVPTDTSLVTISTEPAPEEPAADDWGLVDEDGDGIILDPVRGVGFNGYMMVVLDPSRVIMGSVPTNFGRRGYTVEEMVQYYDAVAGINAGGFLDPNGTGNGSTPDSLVMFDGTMYYGDFGLRDGFVGFDGEGIMHICNSRAEIEEANIQYGASFGPALVVNGEPLDAANLASGLNPRTAIGQRSDGAVLLLVIDGRQATSAGARFSDLVDIMMQYGAVNAYNLDGGSSSLLWFEGDYVNNKAHVIGVRPVPTTFLVLKEGASIDG